MPTGEIKKLHKESGKSTKEIENTWHKLQKEAEKNSKISNKYAYSTAVLEKIYSKK